MSTRDVASQIKYIGGLTLPEMLNTANPVWVQAAENTINLMNRRQFSENHDRKNVTICYNNMGRDMGDLGNQLFQLAFLVGMAKVNKTSFKIPNGNSPYYKEKGVKLNCFDIPEHLLHDIPLTENTVNLSEKSFNLRDETLSMFYCTAHYLGILPKNCNINIFGFFQNYMIADYLDDDLRKLLTFKEEHEQRAEDFIKALKSKYKDPVAFVHVRLGDQKDDEVNHPVLTKEYYDIAFKKCLDSNPNTKFLIISDEPEDCKKIYQGPQFIYQNDIMEKEISGHRTEQDLKSYFSAPVDLCIMSKAETLIMANSTFSWWGAWLAKNAKIYAPIRSRWFGQALNFKPMTDFYPPRWEEIWFPEIENAKFNKSQTYVLPVFGDDRPPVSFDELGLLKSEQEIDNFIAEQWKNNE